MKLAHFSGLALMLAFPVANAQSSVPVPQSNGVSTVVEAGLVGQARTFTAAPPSPLCPVGLAARHVADGNMVKTAPGHPHGLGQRLHLTLTSPDARILASATLNVRGWTAVGHLQQAAAKASPVQAVRMVQVLLSAETGRNSSADLWVPGLTSVESVELLAVSYADRSTWAPAAGKSCRVTPDPLMLIAR